MFRGKRMFISFRPREDEFCPYCEILLQGGKCPECGYNAHAVIRLGEESDSRESVIVCHHPDCLTETTTETYTIDDNWIDPAGGRHSHNEIDPASQYE